MAKGGSGNSSMNVVMQWSIGLAGIALLGLIMLILFGNLSNNVGFSQVSGTPIINETGVIANSTTSVLAAETAAGNINPGNYALTNVWGTNTTVGGGYNISIAVSNFQVSNAGVITNSTTPIGAGNEDLYGNVTASYTFNIDSKGQIDSNNFIANYTKSVLNTGEQFPTVGTIIGVALLLFILIALLIFALVKLSGIGGVSKLGSSGGSFGGNSGASFA